MTKTNMKGQVVLTEKDNIKIHTYISPEETFDVTSHIIETEEKLIVVDAQFMLEYAQEVKTYVKDLGKPVVCIIISHAHPDHFLGLEVFKDYLIASTKEIVEQIDQIGDTLIAECQKFHGNRTASQKVVPGRTLEKGLQEIAGIQIEVVFIKDTEANNQLILKLPDHGILIAQDLVYNNIHPYFGQKELRNWIKTVEGLKAMEEYSVVLPGHGRPTNDKVYGPLLEYLQYAETVLAEANSPEPVKAKLLDKFPDYRADHLIDIANDFAFFGEHIQRA